MRTLFPVALCLLLASAAPAEEEGKTDPAKAEAAKTEQARLLNSEAQAEFYLGHYQKALGLYETLYKLRQVPSLLFNIAQCHRKLGQFTEAANVYRSFLVHATPGSAEMVNAQELLSQVEAAIKQGDTATKSAPNEAMQASGSVDRPLVPPPPKPADPTAKSAAAAAHPPAPATVLVESPPPPAKPSRTTAYVLGGLAAAALVGGLALGAISSSAGDSLASGPHPRAEVDSLSSSKTTNAKAADALFVVALGLMVGGVFAW